MFGIGMSEMLIILAVALVVFGPQKLPDVAKSIAKGLRELRKASDDLRASVDFDVDDSPRAPPPRRVIPLADGASDAPVPGAVASSELADAAAAEVHVTAAGVGSLVGGEASPVSRTESGSASGLWPRPAEGTLARGALDARPTPDASHAPDDAEGTTLAAEAPKAG